VIVKVCGITTVADAEACASLGVDWIGLNFVAASPRCLGVPAARAISDAVRGRVVVVGVVADLDAPALSALARDAGLDRLQLHGSEPPELVAALAPLAFKAVRLGGASDVAAAQAYSADPLLCDAKVAGALGGTGVRADASLVAPLARSRPVLLAGGLDPDNVADAIRAVRPWGVDVASGVESRPGGKDLELVARFVAAVRSADQS
jgi:phosphoribosylanthranilate isomerase